MNTLISPYLDREALEFEGLDQENESVGKQPFSPFLDSQVFDMNELVNTWDEIAEIQNLEGEGAFYDVEGSFFEEEEFDHNLDDELFFEDEYEDSEHDEFEEYDTTLQDEFTEYDVDFETGFNDITNEQEDIEYYDNFESIEDYLTEENELHTEESDFDEHKYDGAFQDAAEVEIIENETDIWKRDIDEELNEWESIETDELEEDLLGFGFLKRRFLSEVTFQNGVSIPTISGPELPDQEYYDPNDSSNPLLDTGIKNRNRKLSKNFSVAELAQSGNGRFKFYKARIDPELVDSLQDLRDFLVDNPIQIIDGYYSYKHLKNLVKRRKLKSIPNSPHLSGQGAKIRVRGMSGTQLAKAIVISCDNDVSISIGTTSVAIYIKQRETKITSYIGNKRKRRAARELITRFRELYNNKPQFLKNQLQNAYKKFKNSIINAKLKPYKYSVEFPWDNLKKAALYLIQELNVTDKNLLTEILFYTDIIKALRFHSSYDFTRKANIGDPYWKFCKGKVGLHCAYEKDDWLPNEIYKSMSMDTSVWNVLLNDAVLPALNLKAPPVSQTRPLDKGSKGERVLASPNPDTPKHNISGRYEIDLKGSGEANFIGSTLCVNQAGRHIEGVLANISRTSNSNLNKIYYRIHGKIENNGSYSVFARNKAIENFKFIPTGQDINFYKDESSVGLTFKKTSNEAILTEIAFYKQPRLLKSYEWFPLLIKQKKHIIKHFGDEQIISDFLKKFYSIKRDSLSKYKEMLQAMAVSNFNTYVNEAMTNPNLGVHTSDLILARFYIRTLLGNSKWRPNSNYPFLSQLDWLQRMVSIDIYNRNSSHRQGGHSSISAIENFIGIDPSWSQGKSSTVAINVYKVSLKISGATIGLAGAYRGTVSIEKTDSRKWPKKLRKITYNITLGALGVGAGLKINDTMEGEVASPILWVPQDFPGWVDVAFTGASAGVAGIEGSIKGGFIHIKGRGSLPPLKVIINDKSISPKLKLKLSVGAELTMLKGKIHDKNIPVNLDYLSLKTKTNYSVINNLNRNVHFALGSALLSDPAREAIRIMCAHELVALKNPNSQIKIIAHTDRVDTDQRNLALSAMRAANTRQAIEDVLQDNLKAAFTKVTGRGENEAVKTDRDEKENPKYRRVDIFLNARLVLHLSAA